MENNIVDRFEVTSECFVRMEKWFCQPRNEFSVNMMPFLHIKGFSTRKQDFKSRDCALFRQLMIATCKNRKDLKILTKINTRLL
jgi:hypothetical protein